MLLNLIQQVYEELGPGFTEAIYHNALEVLLRMNKIQYESERIIPVKFRGHVVGNVRSDLIIDRETVVELKSIKTLRSEDIQQTKMYMNLLGIQKGILVNFGPKLEVIPLE